MLGGLQPVERLDGVPIDGTVVMLIKKDGHPVIDRRGPAVIRDGVPVRVGEWEAVELHDPTRTAERRYRRAVTTAGLPDRATRFVEPAGHDWEPDCVSAYGEPGRYGQAHVACVRVRGRFVWLRAATFQEVTDLGADLA
jgi:hypothetical protein